METKIETVQPAPPLTFEQLPRESSKAFAAFRIYLDLGPEERSCRAVAKQIGKSRTLIGRWCRRFDWPARVIAHSAYLSEAERGAIERLATENAVQWWKLHEPVRRKAWLAAEKAMAGVNEAWKRWEKSGRTVGFEGMARMLEVAFKLQQFAAGMPTEVKEVQTTITGKIDVEWEIAIRKAYPLKELPVVDVPAELEEHV